jgi:SAM-dependent methyltransferase
VTLIPSRCVCGEARVDVIGAKDARPVGRCRRCSLIRTCGVPDDYMSLYVEGDRYHSGRAGHLPYRDRYEHDQAIAALRWPRLLSHLRLLDVGCANGAFVRQTALQGVSVEGLEPNPGMAKWAAERCGRPVHQSWTTVRGRFDIVTYHDVIEHVQDPLSELRRVRRYLRPEGLLVVDTPDADDPRFGELTLGWHHMKPQEHLWFFTERHLRWLAGRAGFTVDDIDRPIQGKIVMYARARRAPHAPARRSRTASAR